MFAWVNDEATKRAFDRSNNAYLVFRKMLESGHPPEGWDRLLVDARAPGNPCSSLPLLSRRKAWLRRRTALSSRKSQWHHARVEMPKLASFSQTKERGTRIPRIPLISCGLAWYLMVLPGLMKMLKMVADG